MVLMQLIFFSPVLMQLIFFFSGVNAVKIETENSLNNTLGTAHKLTWLYDPGHTSKHDPFLHIYITL
jgi:hypothetical protein